MGQRRSKLDRHAAELLALRRAGATVAQLTRWLREERNVAAAATTVGRWLDRAPDLDVGAVPDGFDAEGIARILAERSRDEPFPRYARPRSTRTRARSSDSAPAAPGSGSATASSATATACASPARPSPAGCAGMARFKRGRAAARTSRATGSARSLATQGSRPPASCAACRAPASAPSAPSGATRSAWRRSPRASTGRWRS